jgi:hypothetical protein
MRLCLFAIYVLKSRLGRNGDSTGRQNRLDRSKMTPTRTLDRYGIRDFAVPA